MTDKKLDVKSSKDFAQSIPDIKVHGDPDMFKLLCKLSSQEQGWMRSTKVVEIPGYGCVMQTSTQQKNIDGTYSICEAVCNLPGVSLEQIGDNEGTPVYTLVGKMPESKNAVD